MTELCDKSQPEVINNASAKIATAVHDLCGSLVGNKSANLEELFDLYCQHARELGFSARKSTQRLVTGTLDVVKEKYFVCSNEGQRSQKTGNLPKKRKVPETRTRCEENVRVKVNGEGVFEIISHVLEHNHPLTRPEWQHLHRSERVMTENKSDAIIEMCKSGIKPIDQYNLLCTQYGGREAVGHTRKDHYNFVGKLNASNILGGDALNLLRILCEEQSADPNFFFRFLTDKDGSLVAIYWRDSMMREDFDVYGDVFVYDTKHRTNKYNLVCSFFVGVNNHWSNVMFGCALLSDEKIESFEWLFEVFKESMGGKVATTIFTDQDHAIASAIAKIFPETRHRLCLWHIQKNVVSYFGELKQNSRFKYEFRKCLMGCFDKEEFEDCWKKMTNTYGLVGNHWFDRLFDLREKWCTALSKDFFSAGIISSQRSESANNAVGFKACKTTTLTQFYRIFSYTVDRWRATEAELDFRCSRSVPIKAYQGSDLLKHAAEVYTLTLYEDFEREFCTTMRSYARMLSMDAVTQTYEVALNEHYKYSNKVKYIPSQASLSCSCRNYEETGWLCFHCIRVMHINSVFRIPETYIKKRWTKFAKAEVWERFNDPNLVNKKLTPWRHEMMRKYYNLVLKCKDVEEATKLLEEAQKRDMESLDKLLSNMPVEDAENTNTNNVQQPPQVLDPECVKTKGRSARKKGHFERRKGKITTSTQRSTYSVPKRLL